MSPAINQTNYLRFLSQEPIKKQEYAPLLWNWHKHNFPRDTDITEDQLRYWEHLPILPIVATLILTLTVFLLLIFQRNPSLVTGIVAAGLGTIALYLFLSSINDNRISYE
ncbi:hypothetical protein CBL_10285 [Carabus blaptoides fortunei]